MLSEPQPAPVEADRRWDVFISYASVDGPTVARPLAQKLAAQGVSVWLDQNELLLGDRLRAKIDEGLSRSRFGVIILSKSFFDRHWPKQELDAMAARESNGQKVILPVWHEVDHDLIAASSPLLADRISVSTSRGLDRVVVDILRVVRPEAVNGLLLHEPPSLTSAPLSPVRKSSPIPAIRKSRMIWYGAVTLILVTAIIWAGYWLTSGQKPDITPGAHRIQFVVWNSLSRKPENRNEIHLTNEYLAVVIYGDRTFDVSEIDINSVRAADASLTGQGVPAAMFYPPDPKKDRSYDENRDGYPDMKLDFKIDTMRQLDYLSTDTKHLRVSGLLSGSGQRFEGVERVTVIP